MRSVITKNKYLAAHLILNRQVHTCVHKGRHKLYTFPALANGNLLKTFAKHQFTYKQLNEAIPKD